MAGKSSTIPKARGLAPNVVGAIWMLGSAVFFSLSASLVKYTGQHYSAAVQAFYRQAPAVILMLPLMIRLGPKGLWTPRWRIMLYRSFAGAASMVLSYYGYQKMPLLAANALSFTRALWLVPLAMLLLREKVGGARIAATVAGFLGILVMLGPEVANGLEIGLPAAGVLFAAFLIATQVMGLKDISRDMSTAVIMVWSTVLGMLIVLPGALLDWKWPNPLDLGLLAATSATGLIAQTCYIKGMQIGDTAAMAPIDYTRLIFVSIIGFMVFHEVPTPWIVAGGCIVVASTLALTLREQQLAHRARRAETALEAVTEAPET